MTTPATDVPAPETLLAIDPGRAKCGLAVVAGPAAGAAGEDLGPPRCLERAVVPTERLVRAVADVLGRRPEVCQMLIGDGTNSATLRRALAATFPLIPLLIVDEFNTSARARQRFVRENPPPDGAACCRPASAPPKSPTTITPRFCLRKITLQKNWGYDGRTLKQTLSALVRGYGSSPKRCKPPPSSHCW